MKNKIKIMILIGFTGFSFFQCSMGGWDLGDALNPVFHPIWPVTNCYKIVSNPEEFPIRNAKMIVKYLNEDEEEQNVERYSDADGIVCFDDVDIFYAEISAEGYQSKVYDHVFIPSKIALDPL